MLILAGVSLNAVIGDNGIITQAQNATYMQSVAVLEEFFNNYYVEHYEEMSKEENKIQLIKNLEPNWFYNGSPIGYIVDSDGNMHYFINKDGLPDDIKNQIRGGDAGDKTYRDYASMKDVYGITSELNVYYCENLQVMLSLVRTGYGIAVLPEATSTDPETVYVPLAGSSPLSYGVFYKNAGKNPLVRQFISIVLQEVSEG